MGWTPPRRPRCARVVAFVTTEQERPCLRLAQSVWTWRSTSFRRTGRMRPARLCSVSGCDATKFWSSSPANPRLWWRWRPAAAPITGHVSWLDGAIWPYRSPDSAGLCEAVREAAEERRVRCRSDLRGGAAADNAFRGGQERDGAGQCGVFRARDLLVRQRNQASTLFADILASMVWSGLRARRSIISTGAQSSSRVIEARSKGECSMGVGKRNCRTSSNFGPDGQKSRSGRAV